MKKTIVKIAFFSFLAIVQGNLFAGNHSKNFKFKFNSKGNATEIKKYEKKYDLRLTYQHDKYKFVKNYKKINTGLKGVKVDSDFLRKKASVSDKNGLIVPDVSLQEGNKGEILLDWEPAVSRKKVLFDVRTHNPENFSSTSDELFYFYKKFDSDKVKKGKKNKIRAGKSTDYIEVRKDGGGKIVLDLNGKNLQFCDSKGKAKKDKGTKRSTSLKLSKEKNGLLTLNPVHLLTMPPIQTFYFEITDKNVNKDLLYKESKKMAQDENKNDNTPYVIFVTNGLQKRFSENEHNKTRKFILSKDRVPDFYRYFSKLINELGDSKSVKKYSGIREIHLHLFLSEKTYGFLAGTDVKKKIDEIISKNIKLKNLKDKISINFYVDENSPDYGVQLEDAYKGKLTFGDTNFYGTDKIDLVK